MNTTELWEILAETMEALSEHHPEIAQSDLWRELVSLQLIPPTTEDDSNG